MATRKLVELQKEVITPFQKTNYINPLYQKQLSKLNNSSKRVDMSKVLEFYKDFINTFIKELFLNTNNKLSRKQRELRKIVLLSFETYTLLYKYNRYKVNFLENERESDRRLKLTKKQEFSIFRDFVKENSIIFSNSDILYSVFKETNTPNLDLDQLFDKFIDFVYNQIYLKNSKKFRSRLVNLIYFDYKTNSFKVIESVRLTIKILEKDNLTDVDKELIFYKTFEILYKYLLQSIENNNSNLESLDLDIDKLEELVLKETNYINTIDRETDLYISKILLFFIHNSKVIYKNLSETKYKWKLYQEYIFENLFNFLYKLAIHSNLNLSLEDRFNQIVLSFVKALREIDIIEIFKTHKRINQVKSPLTILFDRIQSKIEAYNKEIIYSVNSHLKIDKDSLDLIQKIFRKLNKIEFEIYYLFENGIFNEIGTLHKIYLDYIQDKLKRFENNKVKYKYQIDFFNDVNNSLLVEYFIESENVNLKIQNNEIYSLSNILGDQRLKEEFLNFLFERDILSKNQSTDEIGINILSVIELIVRYDKEIEKDLIKVFGESVNENNKDTLVNKVKDLIFYYYENYSTTNKEVLNVYSGYSVNSIKRIITIDNIVNYNFLDGSKTIDDYLDDNKLHYSENVSEANYSRNIEEKEKELEFKQIYKELITLGVKEVGLIPTLTFHILYQLSLENKSFDIFEFLSKGDSELEEKIVLKLTDKEYVNSFLKEFGLIERNINENKDILEIQNISTFKDFECIKKLYTNTQTSYKNLRRRKLRKSLTHSFIRSKRLITNYYMCIRNKFGFNIVNINKTNIVIGGNDKVLVILTNLYRIFVENDKIREKLKELLSD